jgi:hypothetical protein
VLHPKLVPQVRCTTTITASIAVPDVLISVPASRRFTVVMRRAYENSFTAPFAWLSVLYFELDISRKTIPMFKTRHDFLLMTTTKAGS